MSEYSYLICMTEKSREGTALFWKPEGKGYTAIIEEAGLFKTEDADAIEQKTHKENIAVDKDKLNSYFTVCSLAYFDAQTLNKLVIKEVKLCDY